ncbi:hypothetical protein J6590_059554 [Homalodisca vitripennis]|nr:hypothetical protein J6590_059554 [Homalodisca vitripennis]
MIAEILKDYLMKLLILTGVGVLVGFPVMYSLHRDDVLSSYTVDLSCIGYVNSDLSAEIASYRETVSNIFALTLTGTFKNTTYRELATFVDKFSNRPAGSENLENSIDYVLKLARNYGLDNVHGENVSVPHWVRGNESCVLISPRVQNLTITGLGYSVGTNGTHLEADVLVVQSFTELQNRTDEISTVVFKVLLFTFSPVYSIGESRESMEPVLKPTARAGTNIVVQHCQHQLCMANRLQIQQYLTELL